MIKLILNTIVTIATIFYDTVLNDWLLKKETSQSN